jgi:hypothetical protein
VQGFERFDRFQQMSIDARKLAERRISSRFRQPSNSWDGRVRRAPAPCAWPARRCRGTRGQTLVAGAREVEQDPLQEFAGPSSSLNVRADERASWSRSNYNRHCRCTPLAHSRTAPAEEVALRVAHPQSWLSSAANSFCLHRVTFCRYPILQESHQSNANLTRQLVARQKVKIQVSVGRMAG